MAHSENSASYQNQLPTSGSSSIPGAMRAATLRLFARDNPWRPIATKGLSVAAAMLGLAAIGLFAAHEEGGRGSAAENTPALQAAQLAGAWLKPHSNGGTGKGRPPTVAVAALHGSSASQTQGEGAPVEQHPPPDPSSKAPSETPPAAAGVTKDGRVVLNTANASELTRLPGIGAKRAEKIIQLRQRLKRFRKPTDLLRIRGIGLKTLKKMLPHLVVDPPLETIPENGTVK